MLRVSPEGAIEKVSDAIYSVDENRRFEALLARLAKDERVYAFNAERFRVWRSPSVPGTVLRPDAANLPEVLENLQGRNPHRFVRLGHYVRTVFPVVQSVSVRPVEGNYVEILIWTTDPQTERDDLAVTLA